MCEHHHAAKHILCSQCDMLVALPRLEHGQKRHVHDVALR